MLKYVNKALIGAASEKKRAVNDLNAILYGNLATSNHVVFYNFANREDYIRTGYQGNADFYSIIRKIMDKTKVAELVAYEEKPDQKALARKYKSLRYSEDLVMKAVSNVYRTKALDYDEKSDLYRLLQRPNTNATESMAFILDLFGIFYFSMGEAFLYRETAIDSDVALSLHIAPANLMEVVYSDDENSIIEGWRLNMLNGHTRTLDAKDVFHMKMPNPMYDAQGGQLRGQSPILAGAKYLQQSDAGIKAWIKSTENEGAKGILSPNHADPKLWLNPAQVEDTRLALDKRIHGNENLHKVAVSGMPLQYQQIGLSPQALAIIDGLTHSGVKLCNLWNVDPVLFDPKPTYENKKEARKSLVTDVVIPYLNTLEQGLNNWLVEPFRKRDNKNYHVDFDTTIFSELQPDLELMKKVYGDNRAVSINEYRAMLNLEAREEEVANELLIEDGLILGSDYMDSDTLI